MNNDSFKNDVNALLSKPTTNVISTITGNPAVQSLATANPFISLGLSLASYFTSKSSNKDPKLVEICCIVNLGTQSVAAVQQVQAQLSSLQASIQRSESTSATVFTGYTKVINYPKSIDDYRNDQKNSATDILEPSVADAFKVGGSALTASGIVNTRYQLEQVKNQLGQYDSLVQQVYDFLAKFDAVLSDQQRAFAGTTCAPTAAKQLNDLQQTVTNLKPEFDNGNWNVSATQRALMLGTPTM